MKQSSFKWNLYVHLTVWVILISKDQERISMSIVTRKESKTHRETLMPGMSKLVASRQHISLILQKWTATWQNQQTECSPSEDSDQPGHPPSLIRVFACVQWVAKDPSFLHADSEDSEQTAQFDLSLRWAHSHIVGFVMSRLKCLAVDCASVFFWQV